jgi:predicted phosphodiesterase
MSRIVNLFNVNRRLYTIIVLVVGIVAGIGIWNVVDIASQSGGIFAPPKPFTVAAAGDWGCGKSTNATVANIKSKDPDVILALGDLSYEGDKIGNYCLNTDQWFNTIRSIDKNFFMVVGNHDVKQSNPNFLKNYLAHFGLCPASMPEPCGETYSFNLHKVHFLILNSEYGWEKGSSQYLLAERDLRIASSDPDTDWIIVAYHSARYASIDFVLGNVFFGSDYPEKTKQFLDIYHPLFDKYGVDLVLQGHVHNYQRTYPLKFDAETKLPIRDSIADNNYRNPKGEIYLTVGTAGVGLDSTGPEDKWISSVRGLTSPLDSYYVVKTVDKHYGFLELAFSSDGSSLHGTFYGNDDVNKGSIVLDRFTISK